VTRTLLAAIFVSFILALPAAAGTGFTTQVSPSGQGNATEPYIAIDHSDGTVWVAWQASGSHAARSDDGGRTFVQTPEAGVFSRDFGDVDIAVGGPTPCTTGDPELLPGTVCQPGTHRVYLTSISEVAPLQVKLAYTDDRGAHWTINPTAVANPQLVDRPWLAVYPSKLSADSDKVYVSYHDFSVSQVWVATSVNGGAAFAPSVDVFAGDPRAQTSTFCNSVPSGIEVDPETGEVYVLWITSGLVENQTGGCNITQNENFHDVWMAHSPDGFLWDDHEVFNGPATTNTDEIFAALAVDDSGMQGVGGNVYAAFPDNLRGPQIFDIWFTHSSHKGASWASPALVDSDKGTHYFPWMAAGSSGRVDFIWLNSPDYTPTDTEESPWYVTFAQTIDGTDAAPKFNQTSASSSVMHVGGICTNGIFCSTNNGNRDLADSISIAIDRGGSAGLVWTDQGRVLHGPTHIEYGCVTSQQSAISGANSGLSCKGPAGP
jgi:hypothetical protein